MLRVSSGPLSFAAIASATLPPLLKLRAQGTRIKYEGLGLVGVSVNSRPWPRINLRTRSRLYGNSAKWFN